MEKASEQRRATVLDASTGKAWKPPDSGRINLTFKVSRELPSEKVKEAYDST